MQKTQSSSEKYLRDLKELSGSVEEVPTPPVEKQVEKPVDDMPPVQPPVQKQEPMQEEPVAPVAVSSEAAPVRKFPLSAKEIILVIINFFSVIFLILLLTKLSPKAEELKTLRTTDIQDEAALSFEFNRVNAKKGDADSLDNLFLNESGIINFVNDVEKLKGDESAIRRISFTSQTAVKDRTGNYGIPVVVEMSGSWEDIGNDMEKIQELPYLYRPVTFNARPNVESSSITEVKYGLFVYVKDSLASNKEPGN